MNKPEIVKAVRKLISDIEFAADEALAEKRQIRVIAASGKADRVGDVVNVKGIELDSYRKNPIVLWAHDHYALPIAKAVDMTVEAGKLIMTFQFATAEEYAFADTVYKLVKGGYLKGVSIGARVLEADYIMDDQERVTGIKFSKLELLEVSVVPIPADSKALITAVKSGAISCEDMEECLAKSFEAPLDISTEKPVESNTVSSSPQETIDMEQIAALEKRIAELEGIIAKGVANQESAEKLAASVETTLGALLNKMGVKVEGNDIASQAMSLLQSMTNKVSVQR